MITPKVTHRAAITTPAEVGALLRAIESYEGHPSTLIALRLLPHVFVRPGELRHAEWKEFDLDKAVWTIPEQDEDAPGAQDSAFPAGFGNHRHAGI